MEVAMTATLSQGNHVLKIISEKNVPSSQLQKLIASGLLSDLLDGDVDAVDRNEFRKLLGLIPKEQQLVVDYGKPFDLMYAEAGFKTNPTNFFEYFERAQLEFGGQGVKKLFPRLISFTGSVTSELVLKRFRTTGLRPACVQELVAFAIANPDLFENGLKQVVAVHSHSVYDDSIGGDDLTVSSYVCQTEGGSGRMLMGEREFDDTYADLGGVQPAQWSKGSVFLAFPE